MALQKEFSEHSHHQNDCFFYHHRFPIAHIQKGIDYKMVKEIFQRTLSEVFHLKYFCCMLNSWYDGPWFGGGGVGDGLRYKSDREVRRPFRC